MSDWLDLGLGSVSGAVVSEGLRYLIKKAKEIKDFKPLSKDLASAMEKLIPLTEQIVSIRDKLDSDPQELKNLRATLKEAKEVVDECGRGVKWFNKSSFTKKINRINQYIHKFCDIDLQLLQYKEQLLQHKELSDIWSSVGRIEESFKALRNDFWSVPKLNKVLVGFDVPLVELKTKLLSDSVDSLVVSAPPGYGKTTLVNQLCHDEGIKREFKHIIFIVVSSNPNFRAIVQKLFRDNGYGEVTFEDDSRAEVGLTKLVEKLKRKIRENFVGVG